MKLKAYFHQSPDILIVLTVGLISLLLSLFPQFHLLKLARWIFGFTFFYITSGFAITRFLPKSDTIITRLLAASTLSLLLTYPAAILTTLVEGQTGEAIFTYHLTTSLSILLIISVLLSLLTLKIKKPKPKINQPPILLVVSLIVFSLLSLLNLNRADIYGDEYDLGYQAYNLVDGIVAGRKAYFISLNQHPPLAITIKHFSMNILEPSGLDNLQDWQFRVSEGLVGILIILAAYKLLKELFSEKVALFASLLLAVNNYLVWMARIFHREMYLTFFMVVGLLFYLKAKTRKKRIYILLSGLGFGSALLVKETGLVILTIPIFDFLFNKSYRKISKQVIGIALLLFFPVIIYNLTAFLTTGYADVFFSKLLGIHRPYSTPIKTNPISHTTSLISFLSDIYSPLLFTSIVLSSLFLSIRRNIPRELILWIIASVIFFPLSAIRAYYFLFLTIPLISILAITLSKLNQYKAFAAICFLSFFSAWYSIKTNHIQSFSTVNLQKPDGAVIVNRPITQDFSLAARTWSQEYGYKNLQVNLDQIITQNDCLIVSDSIDSLAARRYLSRFDDIKQHYLGTDYPTRYPRCPSNTSLVDGKVYLVSSNQKEAGQLIKVITDHLGNQRFFLFLLEKGIYS